MNIYYKIYIIYYLELNIHILLLHNQDKASIKSNINNTYDADYNNFLLD